MMYEDEHLEMAYEDANGSQHVQEDVFDTYDICTFCGVEYEDGEYCGCFPAD